VEKLGKTDELWEHASAAFRASEGHTENKFSATETRIITTIWRNHEL
jgi:hypothetical protein